MQMMSISLHIVVRRAPDVPGQWLAHCLELDVVSQGNSLQHAITMIREAVEIVVIDDLSKGFDPLRRRASQEDWDDLWARMNKAGPIDLAETVRSEPEFLVLESVLTLAKVSPQELADLAPLQAPQPQFQVPIAFAPPPRQATV